MASNFIIQAIEYQTDDGSVVHSGVACADAVLEILQQDAQVTVDFTGLKGASSSYFNVFLRRIDEECGVGVLKEVVRLEFGNKVQEAMFDRSHRSLLRPATSPAFEPKPSDSQQEVKSEKSSSFFGFFRSLLGMTPKM